MFKKRFCVECTQPFRVGFICEKCKRPICYSCVVDIGGLSGDYCIFCAKNIIWAKLKYAEKRRKICTKCGTKIKNSKFGYCPYCGVGLKIAEEKCELNK